MRFSIRNALVATAYFAALLCVAGYLPALAFFVLSFTPLVWFVATRKKMRGSVPTIPYYSCLVFVTIFAYVGSIGPYSALVAPTEWDRDHAWTQAIQTTGFVIYAPIISKPWYSLLARVKLDLIYTEYAAEWYSYGLYILGRPNKYTVPSG